MDGIDFHRVLPDNGKVLLDGKERNLEEDFKRWLQELDAGEEVWIL